MVNRTTGKKKNGKERKKERKRERKKKEEREREKERKKNERKKERRRNVRVICSSSRLFYDRIELEKATKDRIHLNERICCVQGVKKIRLSQNFLKNKKTYNLFFRALYVCV